MQTIDGGIDFNHWVGLYLPEFVRVQTEGGGVIDFRSSLSYLHNASPADEAEWCVRCQGTIMSTERGCSFS